MILNLISMHFHLFYQNSNIYWQFFFFNRNQTTIDFVINGEFAIEKVKDKLVSPCCEPYKLIFMDIEMPGMDGFTTFKNIR